MTHRVSAILGSSAISLECGKVAKQADGSVLVRQGDTVVLVTAVYERNPSESEDDVLPLTVDYREKTYAAGRIPGGFFKREGRPTEKEILTARLIDRPIRPLFPKGFQHELQIMSIVLSSDGEYDPDVLAVLGASAALQISPLPYPERPLGVVRVAFVEGKWVANPTYQELEKSPIDLVVAATKDGIISLEGGFKEVPEQKVFEAISFGYEQALKLTDMQKELAQKLGKPKAKKEDFSIRKANKDLLLKIKKEAAGTLDEINKSSSKEKRESSRNELLTRLTEEMAATDSEITPADVKLAFEEAEKEQLRNSILDTSTRIGGRSLTELRQITCEIGLLPRTHGSGLFTRGETQSLSVTTLGTSEDEQLVEALEGETVKRFMLHYNFPPFSVGEIRPVRSPGRREIGHGALAERALMHAIPSKEDFPYTIRVVSDILESNGSSSMATVCASSLSLMDAGVPIASAISGVAMGLIKEADRFAILTDISGIEDHVGDTDFKVAGTSSGITALQVDVKLFEGMSPDLVEKIIAQAHPARIKVLEIMSQAIDKPRTSLSSYAPRITTLRINPDKIREVIGSGGKTIRKIIEQTKATIDIEDDGQISIASTDSQAVEKAIEIIKGLTEEPEVGKIYSGKVKRIMNFGAFCEILPGKEGLVHISELDDKYVKNVDDVVKIGDEIKVKVIEIDEQGRLNLSRKRARESSDSAQ